MLPLLHRLLELRQSGLAGHHRSHGKVLPDFDLVEESLEFQVLRGSAGAGLSWPLFPSLPPARPRI